MPEERLHGSDRSERRDNASDEDNSAERERYRALIASRLFQALGIIVLLIVAVVLFDSW